MLINRSLENIEPFNEVFFENCFYNAFFPIVRALNKSIVPFLINNLNIYSFRHNEFQSEFVVNYTNAVDLKSLMEREGISIFVHRLSHNIIEDIIYEINNNRYIIIWIDCYYESLKIDIYQKKHWPHSLLIYGYDKSNQTFDIIEHTRSENLTYNKLQISFSEVEHAYKGYIDNFQNSIINNIDTIEGASFYGFGDESKQMSEVISEQDSSIEYIKQYHDILISNDGLIKNSLDELKKFSKIFSITVLDENSLKNTTQILINSFNNMLNAKRIEKYRTTLLFGNDSILLNILEEIIVIWGYIRSKIAKYMYSLTYNIEVFRDVVDKFKKSIELEAVYYKELFKSTC